MLYDHPATQLFSPDELGREQLQDAMHMSLRDTLVANPASVRDLRLDPRTSRTQTGRRYLAPALLRVCRVAAPGLSRVLLNVAGDARPQDAALDLFSVPTACAIFNQIVDLRFGSLLSNYQLVTDEARQRVEGFLGPKTHYLENSTFMDLAEPAVLEQPGVRFYGATLVGRRLCVRYLSTQRTRTPLGELQEGFMFVVTEAGDDAVRAYRMYCFTAPHRTPGYFLMTAPTTRHHQKRTGNRFEQRLRALLTGVLRGGMPELPERLTALQELPLFAETSERGHKRSVSRILRRLKLAGMPADIAQQVLGRVLGHDNSAGVPMTETALRQLTDFDLFLSALQAGAERNAQVREVVECATFSAFFGE